MTPSRRKWIWGVCMVLWPALVILAYYIQPPEINGSWFDVSAMAVLMIVSALFYFQVRETPIIVIEGVSIAAFLIYGLFVEMALLQAAMFINMLSKRLGKDDWIKYPVNMTMFLMVSISAAIVYFVLGGQTGIMESENSIQWIPVFGYILASFVSNHIYLYLFRKWIRAGARFFERNLLWQALTTGIVIPVGLVLYILYSQLGTTAFYFIAVPVITLSVIFRLVSNSHEINLLLEKTSELGRELTEKLDVDHILKKFFNGITTMAAVDYAYILTADESRRLHIEHRFEKDPDASSKQDICLPIELGDRGIRVGTKKEWNRFMKGCLPPLTESVMIVPMRHDNHSAGAIIVASKTRRAFEKHHLKIMDIVASFLVVAIKNAKSYEKTKMESERDALTGLYNYKYFMSVLTKLFNMEEVEPFTVTMIDIDHFKQVNDTYGHETGNDVLKGAASCLLKLVGDNGLVARYGGEEFLVLLFNTNQRDALEWAEDIRLRIAAEPFLVQDEKDSGINHLIHITASIGFATAPEQGDDPLSLIRNADRAMYSGAKQRGRNRVASYIG
ncbi:sensor domain-containing diguanylate cyclase [Camelliibacillus cellulosilyticus]|uniref:Sensor domain-containing diguanylate cyclase n=1 Tax=Camelliibacillus cellulosilyticus TaxID=2174486 RepID=A0ABV9GJJ5_9BACL